MNATVLTTQNNIPNLSNSQSNFILETQKKLQKMDYARLSADELNIVINKHKKALENSRLEGLYETPFEKALYDVFFNEKAPPQLYKQFVVESLIKGL